jgi:hypothetical protein
MNTPRTRDSLLLYESQQKRKGKIGLSPLNVVDDQPDNQGPPPQRHNAIDTTLSLDKR